MSVNECECEDVDVDADVDVDVDVCSCRCRYRRILHVMPLTLHELSYHAALLGLL